VINGSTNPLSAFALATVVLMRLCSIKEQAMLESIAFLCAVFLPKWLCFFPCLIFTFFTSKPAIVLGGCLLFTLP
jgi:hypothetical protein